MLVLFKFSELLPGPFERKCHVLHVFCKFCFTLLFCGINKVIHI